MTKVAYLAELRRKLKGLPENEIDAACAYYDEYFSDAGSENEEQTAAELGSPAEVAAGIIGDRALRDVTGEETTTRKGLSTIWLVVLGIFASPIALPIGISLIAVLFALLVAAFSCIVAFFATAAALLVAGIVSLCLGVYALFIHFATGLCMVGTGLMCTALGAALMLVMLWLSKVTINGIAILGARVLKKRQAGKAVV
jgi:uncharacterized membrane protein